MTIASVCFLNGGLFPETHRARPVQRLLATPGIGPLLARAMRSAGFRKDDEVDRRTQSACERRTRGPLVAVAA